MNSRRCDTSRTFTGLVTRARESATTMQALPAVPGFYSQHALIGCALRDSEQFLPTLQAYNRATTPQCHPQSAHRHLRLASNSDSQQETPARDRSREEDPPPVGESPSPATSSLRSYRAQQKALTLS